MVMNVSLDTASINTINISTLDLEYDKILAKIGLNHTCRSRQMLLKCHSSTEI